MKIFTEKRLREYIEEKMYQEDFKRRVDRRLDELTEELHKLGWKVEALEGADKVNKTEVTYNG